MQISDLSQNQKQTPTPPYSSVPKINANWEALKYQLYALFKNFSEEQRARHLSDYMRTLFQSLDDQPDFIYALHVASSTPRGTHPWNEHLLYKDTKMQLDLVTYFADCPTPIHDFPHLASIHLVLKGRVHVQHYQRVATPVSPHYPINKILRKDAISVDNNEMYWLSPNQDTIQEIRAHSGRAILLRAWLFSTEPKKDNNWYFPISPQNNQQFFAQRLKRLG